MDFVNFNGKSRQFIVDRIQQNGLLVRYVPVLDLEIVMKAVQQNGMALKYAIHFSSNRNVGIAAVKQNGLALQFCSPDLRRNKEVVMEAVKQIGVALSFAEDNVKGDKEVVLAAVNENGEALEFASPRLKADRDVIMTAMHNTPFAIEYIPRHVMTKPFVIELVQMNGNILSFLHSIQLPFQSDKDVVLAAVNQNGEALKYASYDLQSDPLVLSYAKYSTHPIEMTHEQNEQVETFLKESRDTYETFKRLSKSRTNDKSHTMKNLSNFGPYHHSNMLKKYMDFLD